MDSTEFIAKHQDRFVPTPILEIHGYNDWIVPFGDIYGGYTVQHPFFYPGTEIPYFSFEFSGETINPGDYFHLSTGEWPGYIPIVNVRPQYKGSGITGRSARHELLLFAMKQSHTRYLVFRKTSSALGNREKWASFNKCSDYKSPYLKGGDAFQCGVPVVEGSTKGYFIETSRDCHGDVEVVNVVIERRSRPLPGCGIWLSRRD